MNLNSIKVFQDLDVEFTELPIRIQNRMEEVDELVDELDESDEPNEKLQEKIERLDNNIVEMLNNFKAERESEAEEKSEPTNQVERVDEKPLEEQALPVVDTNSAVEDNVSENANEEVAQKESNPYFWFQP